MNNGQPVYRLARLLSGRPSRTTDIDVCELPLQNGWPHYDNRKQYPMPIDGDEALNSELPIPAQLPLQPQEDVEWSTIQSPLIGALVVALLVGVIVVSNLG